MLELARRTSSGQLGGIRSIKSHVFPTSWLEPGTCPVICVAYAPPRAPFLFLLSILLSLPLPASQGYIFKILLQDVLYFLNISGASLIW